MRETHPFPTKPWLVSGTNGENVIEARSSTLAEAWHRACSQAAAVGMIR